MLLKKNDVLLDDKEDWEYYEPNTNLRLIVLMILFIVAMLVVGLAYANSREIKVKKALTVQYAKETQDIKADIKNNLVQINEEYASKKLYAIFDPSEIYEITSSNWTYELYHNDIKIDNGMDLIVKDGDFIILREKRTSSTLPLDIIMKGSLTHGDPNDNISYHLTMTDMKPLMTLSTEGLETSYKYAIKNTLMKDSFNIVLSKELVKYLGFSKDTLNVAIENEETSENETITVN